MPNFTNPTYDAGAPQQAVEAEQAGEVALLKSVEPQRRVVVRFTDICAHVKVLVTPGAGAPAAAAPPPAAEGGDVEQGTVNAPATPGSSKQENAAPKERQVLFSVNGCVAPGEILALMGPSGSGKSSLLTVLGGRNNARITGALRYNGHPLNKAMKRRMGFVTQDDLLYAELTTFETLYYAALLRLPKTWTREQKEERVDMVLRGLGLDKCRDTIIGNHMMRGVSGGERKRVSIGHELLINPSVILLDEPTSGLDSTTALKLIQTLRALASGGRTIIASIHQPSSRLYTEFDKLMLLSEGHCIYYGDARASAHWFALQGVPVPFGVSMPDHLLDLACGDLTGDTPPAEAAVLQRRLADAFEQRTFGLGEHGVRPEDFGTAAPGIVADAAALGVDGRQRDGEAAASSSSGGSAQRSLELPQHSSTTAVSDSPSRGTPATALNVTIVKPASVAQQQDKQRAGASPGTAGSSSDDDEEEDEVEEGEGKGQAAQQPHHAEESKWGATYTQQVVILASRCLRVRRFQSLSIQRFVEVILVALLAGLFWFQVGGKNELTDQTIGDINGLLFFQILFTAFSSMFSALFTFPADMQMLIKERQSGMYRLSTYYVARTLSDFPMDCLIPTIFQIIIYFMGGLRLAPGSYFCNWASMLLTLLVAQSLGLFLSATVNNQKTLLSITTVFMLATMLVAGFYVQNVPVWIAWAKYLSFIRYAYILMQQIEFQGRGMSCSDYYRDNPSAPQGLTWCPATGSTQIPGEVQDPVTVNVCVLLLFLIAIRIAVYVSLARRTNFKVKST